MYKTIRRTASRFLKRLSIMYTKQLELLILEAGFEPEQSIDANRAGKDKQSGF